MIYISDRQADGRYAVYIDRELVAYISCPKTYSKIAEFLENRLAQGDLADALPETSTVKSIQNTEATF